MTTYDLLVLGSGPGGYVGAIKAAQLGMKVCVVEKEKLGGTCLNLGCIPSKSLIHQANVYRSIDELSSIGVKCDSSELDYKKVFEKSRAVALSMSKGVEFLLKKNNVDVIKDIGTIKTNKSVSLSNGEVINCCNILIATGSVPRTIPGFEFDGQTILSSNDALMMESLPKSMIILGGGAIGCEFAYILSSFGVKVTIIEMMEHILPQEDEENVKILARSFKKYHIDVLTSTKASSYTKTENALILDVEDKDGNKKQIEAEKMLVVVGRNPLTSNIGLENIGIKTEKGFIPVRNFYETNVDGVYACGDVIASPLLAHVASKEAEIAVLHMAGNKTQTHIHFDTIPAAVYTEPQFASFGLNEEQLKKNGLPYEKTVFPYRAIGKPAAIGKPDGQVKLLLVPGSHELQGASIVGSDASELIHELLLAKKKMFPVSVIAEMIHAHPTISEAIMEASRLADGKAIHSL